MVKADKKVADEFLPNVIPLWLEEIRNGARIVRFSFDDNKPFDYCARVNNENISTMELMREIIRGKSDDEIAAFLSELSDYYLVKKHLEDIGQPITKADLIEEFKRIESEVAEDPQFNGVPLIDLLAAQKKSVESLMSEPGFILRAMVRKACDKKNPISIDEQKKYFQEHKDSFDFREVLIRILSIYYKKNNGEEIPGVTRESVIEKGKNLRRRIDNGEDFAVLASEYAEDPGLKKTGGLVGTPLTRSSAVFRTLKELLVIFDAKKGDVIGPIETDFGVHIIKLINVKDKTFVEVQGKVLKEMRVQQRKKWLANIKKSKKPSDIGVKGILKLFFPGIIRK